MQFHNSWSSKSYLRLDEHEVDKDHDKVVLDIFVGEALAARTLRQSDTFALGAIIGTTVGAVQVRDRVRAFDADGHRVMAPLKESVCVGVTDRRVACGRST